MNDNKILELCVVGGCLVLYYLWKRYHTKYMQKKENCNPFLELASMAYAAMAIFMLCVSIKIWGNFTTIYIVVPISVGLLYIFRQYDEKYFGFYCILKGIYYFVMAIYSIWKYYSKSENLPELAIGFTIALAIFESIIAIRDGLDKIKTDNDG